MNVVARISSLSTTGKIILALIAALGAVAAIALGYHYGIAGAAGGIFMVIGSMFRFIQRVPGRTRVNETTSDLADERSDRAARDDLAARRAAESRARRSIAVRDGEAHRQAEVDAARMSDAEFLDSISSKGD